MKEPRYQHLTEAFNSIISMMLASLRVRGWRGLLDLPNIIIASIYLRRLGKEFAALVAGLDLTGLDLTGIDLSALPPAPATQPAPPESAPPQPEPELRAQPIPSTRPRPRLVASNDAPATAPALPVAVPPDTTARRPRSSEYARHQAFARPRQAPDPRTILNLPTNLRDPDRT